MATRRGPRRDSKRPRSASAEREDRRRSRGSGASETTRGRKGSVERGTRGFKQRPNTDERRDVGPPQALGELILKAADLRQQAVLPDEQTNAFRLVHGVHDGLDGLFINRLGDYALLRLRSGAWSTEAVVKRIEAVLRELGFKGAFALVDEQAKHQSRTKAEQEERLNAGLAARGFGVPDESFVVQENGRRFEMSFQEGFSQGIFLDMRGARQTLSERWKGREVVNLFSYTCGFGVALAPSNHVVNVDVSAKYLAWGGRNYALNGIEFGKEHFVHKDAFAYLDFAVKKGIQYDALVIDPPVYSRGKKGLSRSFTLKKDLAPLVDTALRALRPDGELFISTNLAALSQGAFRAIVSRAAAAQGRRLELSFGPGADFPAPPQDYHLKTALVGGVR